MLFRHFVKEQLRTALVPSLALMLSPKIILTNSTGKKDTLILFSFAFYYRWIQFIFIGPSHFFFYLFIWLCWVLVVTCDLSVAGCEIFPHQRRNLSPLRWEWRILATGLPDESSVDSIYFCFSDLLAHFSIWLFILFLLICNTSYSSSISLPSSLASAL